MSAPKREQFKNNASTTLNGGIDGSQTSIVVTDASVFPSDGNFRIIVESEIMLVTGVSTNTLTVVRAQEGTSGAAHSDSIVVTHIVTADSINRMGKDNVVLWGSTPPPLNKLVGTDGKTLLTSADFTWENQGGATVTDLDGTILLRCPPSSGNNLRSLVRSTPSAPWTLIAACRMFGLCDDGSTANPLVGIALRESGTSKLYTLGMNRNGTTSQRFGLDKWSNNTTFSATPWKVTNQIFFGNVAWFKIVDNNTNLVFYISNDGVDWHQVYTESRTTFMAGAPNQFGIYTGNGSNTSALDLSNRLVHWHTE